MEEITENDHTYDLSGLILSKNITSMYQDGNFLVCTSDSGQTFRQAIPVGKILNKDKEGRFILEQFVLRG